jgi:transposase-like protein
VELQAIPAAIWLNDSRHRRCWQRTDAAGFRVGKKRPACPVASSPHLTTTASPGPLAGWRDLLRIDDLDERNALGRTYLESLRWPDGATCPRCGSGRTTPVPSRGQIDCRECRYRFSVTSGTFLHDSAVPLWKWLVAVSLFVEADDGLPAHRLSATIGVSYKTAWSLGHRIRSALAGDLNGAAAPDGPLVVGSYHQVSARYLPAYEIERAWRERNRGNPDAFAAALRSLLSAPRTAPVG